MVGTQKKKKRGTLIVLDGSDGSGKATQAKALVRTLKRANNTVRTLDFPQYEKNFFGSFLGDCLHGRHGDFLHVDAYIASVLYAADRFESKKKLEKWLVQGNVVILDRYVSANQIHQGGKISSAAKRNRFMAWLNQMEYGVFGLPRPDMTIYLDVPVAVSQKLLDDSGKRKDHAEQDLDYLENSRKSALRLARSGKNWYRIQCALRGRMRSIEDIHKDIVDVCIKRRIIKRHMVK